MRYIISFFIIVLKVCSLWSQEQFSDSIKIYPLKEVIITATRNEKDYSEVSRSVSIISREQIQNDIYNDIAQLLSEKEGTYIVGTGQNYGMVQSIFMRGANSNQTTLMIDNVRITDPSSPNNAVNLLELSLANIERVEIVRGPHSTLFGSSAIGGVVNAFSRKNQKLGLNTEIEMKAGTMGKGTLMLNGDLFFNYSSPVGFYFNAEVNNSNIEGLDATIDTITNPNVYNKRDKDDFHHRDLVGKIGYNDEIFDFFTSFKRTDQDIDVDESAFNDDDNYKLNFTRNLFTGGASYKINDVVNIQYIGGFSNLKRSATNDSSIIDNIGNYDQTYYDDEFRGSTTTNELQVNVKHNGFNGLIGSGIYSETMTSKSYFYSDGFEIRTDIESLKLKTTTKSVFIYSDINGKLINERFKNVMLGLGSRLYHHSTFGFRYTYELNPSFRIIEGTMLYALYSTGFNAPSLYQLYSPSKDFTSGITRGNTNLKPEISTSTEIGFKQNIGNNLNFNIAYYHTFIKDVIEYAYLWEKNTPVDSLTWSDYRGDTYMNLGEQIINGIEFSLSTKIGNNIFINCNINLVDGKLKYKPSQINPSHTLGNHIQLFNSGMFLIKEGEYLGLVRRPNTFNLSLSYLPIEKLSLCVNFKYVGSRGDIFYDANLGPFGALGSVPLDSYTLLDLLSQLRLNKYVSFGVKLENVFNKKYTEIRGFTTRGRGIYANTRLTF